MALPLLKVPTSLEQVKEISHEDVNLRNVQESSRPEDSAAGVHL
ncbi:MAG TPA: hypothetical protein VIB79_28180 [Candidatus Binatia bacterium]|jgi:hypothetical protein